MAGINTSVKEPLRIGVLIDSFQVWAWQRALIETIASAGYARLDVVVWFGGEMADVEPRVRRNGLLDWLIAPALELTYRALEWKIYCDDDAFGSVDARALLANVPRLDAGEIETCTNCDLFLDLRTSSPPHTPALTAKYGVWCVDDLDFPRKSGAPPGFWPVACGWHVTRMGVRGSGREGEYMIEQSAAATQRVSVKLNRSNAYWNAITLVPKALQRLAEHGEQHPQSTLDMDLGAPVRPCGPATARSLAKHIVRNVKRRWAERTARAGTHQWLLLANFGTGMSTAIESFEPLVPPADRYWADPHVIANDGKHYVFFEEYVESAAKGHIAVLSLDPDGISEGPRAVLKRDYHLSYPFVFEYDDTWYMVPESMDHRTVDLYRCVRFPDQWEWQRTLLDNVEAVDPTLVQHEGRWWLFVNMRVFQGGSPSELLFVYHTDCPITGTWVPHAQNPIVSDVTRARPAGAFQRLDGMLCRPSQDCSVRYGYGLRINHVTVLTPTHYSEVEIARIEPDARRPFAAIHSFAYEGGLTVMDALVDRRRYSRHAQPPAAGEFN